MNSLDTAWDDEESVVVASRQFNWPVDKIVRPNVEVNVHYFGFNGHDGYNEVVKYKDRFLRCLVRRNRDQYRINVTLPVDGKIYAGEDISSLPVYWKKIGIVLNAQGRMLSVDGDDVDKGVVMDFLEALNRTISEA